MSEQIKRIKDSAPEVKCEHANRDYSIMQHMEQCKDCGKQFDYSKPVFPAPENLPVDEEQNNQDRG
jgi:Fe2+ or Zn2+ uptake regulation protein